MSFDGRMDSPRRSRKRRSAANPPAPGIARIQDQGRLAGDERATFNRWNHLALDDLHRTLEDAADDALLAPGVPGLEFAVGDQAGEFGARARAARGTIVRLSGTEDEVLAVDTRLCRG